MRTERKIIHLVLECIVEIGRRKIYLQQAYPSLFEFLTTKYGYSAGAAMRRIEGARLLNQWPEIASKLEDGSLNLSQLAKAAQSFRHVEKSQRLSSAAKFEIRSHSLPRTSNRVDHPPCPQRDRETDADPKEVTLAKTKYESAATASQ